MYNIARFVWNLYQRFKSQCIKHIPKRCWSNMFHQLPTWRYQVWWKSYCIYFEAFTCFRYFWKVVKSKTKNDFLVIDFIPLWLRFFKEYNVLYKCYNFVTDIVYRSLNIESENASKCTKMKTKFVKLEMQGFNLWISTLDLYNSTTSVNL